MKHITDNLTGYAGLLMGIIAGSFAAVLVRLAQGAGMPSLVIAAGRLGIAAIVLLPFAFRDGWQDMRGLSRRSWGLVMLAGLLMAIHFAAFISALEYTSVLTTLVFSGTTPFYAAFIGWFAFGDRPRRNVWFGIMLALIGTVIVASGGDAGTPSTREAPLLGASLAFSAAFAIAVYFAVGRQVRANLNTVTYSALVFGLGAVWLFLILPMLGYSMLGYSREAYLWLLAIAGVAQLIGHSGWNLALGGFSAALVSLGLLMVPVTGTVTAFFLLQETPGIASIIGSVIILFGIGVAVFRRRPR